MNLLPNWMKPMALRRKPEVVPDPGDMGTAFGLEYSMGAPLAERVVPPAAGRVLRHLPRWLTTHRAR